MIVHTLSGSVHGYALSKLSLVRDVSLYVPSGEVGEWSPRLVWEW